MMILEFYYVGVIAHLILVSYYLTLISVVGEIYREEIDDKLLIFLIYAVLSSVLSWISALSMLALVIRLHLRVEEYLLIDYLKENNKDKLTLKDYVDFPSVKFIIKEIDKLVVKYNIEHLEYYYDRFEKDHTIYIGPTNVLDNLFDNYVLIEIDRRFMKLFGDELLIFSNIEDKDVSDYEILIIKK